MTTIKREETDTPLRSRPASPQQPKASTSRAPTESSSSLAGALGVPIPVAQTSNPLPPPHDMGRSYSNGGMNYGSYGQGSMLQFAPGSFGANARATNGDYPMNYGSYGVSTMQQYGSYGNNAQFGSYGANANGGMQYGSYGIAGPGLAGSLGHRYGSFGNRFFPSGSPGGMLDPNDFRTNRMSTSIESDRSGLKQSQREGELARDYTCCGLDLIDLHALLEHFEDCHVVVAEPYAPPTQQGYAGQYAPPHPHQQQQQPYVGQNGYTPTLEQPQQQYAGAHFNAQGVYVDANGQPFNPSPPKQQPQRTSQKHGRSGGSSYNVPPGDISCPFDPDDMELDAPTTTTQGPLASALSNLSFNSSTPSSPSLQNRSPYSTGPPPSAFHYPSPPNAPHPALQQYSNPNSPAAGRAIAADIKQPEGVNTKPINALEAPPLYNDNKPVSAFDTTTVLPRQRGYPVQGYHPNVNGFNGAPTGSGGYNSRASMGGFPQTGYAPAAYQQRASIGGFPSSSGNGFNSTAPPDAFNAYAGYSDFSSKLPGTQPSLAEYTKLANEGGGGKREEDEIECVPPALLFATGGNQPPPNTPSGSRAPSPVSLDRALAGINPKLSNGSGNASTSPSSTTSSSSKESNLGMSNSPSIPTTVAPAHTTSHISTNTKSKPAPKNSSSGGASTTLSRPGSSLLMSKPFRCPKPNCNKSYKQANGLKYHMTHGSCNFAPPKDLEQVQLLLASKRSEIMGRKASEGDLKGSSQEGAQSNTDISAGGSGPGGGDANETLNQALNDPNYDLNQIPEGDLREVEREAERRLRPFACSVGDCNRRYKNMNGLRYHYQHSGDHGAMGLALLASGVHECLAANKNRATTTSATTATNVHVPARSAAGTPAPQQQQQWTPQHMQHFQHQQQQQQQQYTSGDYM